MSLFISRKVFIVVAGGNTSAQRHFEDTIQRKRTLNEVRRFLPTQEIENLEKVYHGSDFIVWGAVPGPMNENRWEKMTPGDVVLIYNNGRIRFAGEIAAKVRNPELARYFWREDDTGVTWVLMYFIVNEERTDVPIEKLNPLFGLFIASQSIYCGPVPMADILRQQLVIGSERRVDSDFTHHAMA